MFDKFKDIDDLVSILKHQFVCQRAHACQVMHKGPTVLNLQQNSKIPNDFETECKGHERLHCSLTCSMPKILFQVQLTKRQKCRQLDVVNEGQGHKQFDYSSTALSGVRTCKRSQK